MELGRLLRRRRNVYGFLPREFTESVLQRILENARHVPSAGFTQDFDLIVVRDPATRKRLAEAANQVAYEKLKGVVPNFIEGAPVIVVPCGNKTRFEAKYGKTCRSEFQTPMVADRRGVLLLQSDPLRLSRRTGRNVLGSHRR